VKTIGFFSQVGLEYPKTDTGLGHTTIGISLKVVQPLLEVNVYLILKVFTPAIAGVNKPVVLTAVPE
jgi:hypothetical protein